MKNLFSKVQPGDEIIAQGGATVKILRTIKGASKSITIGVHKMADDSTLILQYDLNGRVTKSLHPTLKRIPDIELFYFSHIVEKTFLDKLKNFFKL